MGLLNADLAELAAKQSPLALEALERIAELCAIEARVTGKPPDIRGCVRQSEARPLVEQMHA